MIQSELIHARSVHIVLTEKNKEIIESPIGAQKRGFVPQYASVGDFFYIMVTIKMYYVYMVTFDARCNRRNLIDSSGWTHPSESVIINV